MEKKEYAKEIKLVRVTKDGIEYNGKKYESVIEIVKDMALDIFEDIDCIWMEIIKSKYTIGFSAYGENQNVDFGIDFHLVDGYSDDEIKEIIEEYLHRISQIINGLRSKYPREIFIKLP